MTDDRTWTVELRHVWGGLLWALTFGLVICGFGFGHHVTGYVGLAMSAVTATYAICASLRAHMADEREVFEHGREVGDRVARIH